MGGLQLAHKWTDSGCHWRPWILTSELAARMLTLGRTRRVGGGGGGGGGGGVVVVWRRALVATPFSK